MEHLNLLRKIAWTFHKSTGLDWDELFQEASLSYLKALKTYDPEKGKITTYIWCHVMSDLKDYEYKERLYHAPLCDLKEACNKVESQSSLWTFIPEGLEKVIDLISRKAEVIDSLLMAEKPESKIKARNYIRSLLFQEGETLDEVRGTMLELKHIFS